MTLEARGSSSSTTVEVEGDPLLEHSVADYRAAEAFLLRAGALADRAQAALRSASDDADAGDRIRGLAREVILFARAFGDAGRFYDGNFDPPTDADRARLDELETALDALEGGGS